MLVLKLVLMLALMLILLLIRWMTVSELCTSLMTSRHVGMTSEFYQVRQVIRWVGRVGKQWEVGVVAGTPFDLCNSPLERRGCGGGLAFAARLV